MHLDLNNLKGKEMRKVKTMGIEVEVEESKSIGGSIN